MCKMSLKEIGDMQLSRQTATDWGHGMKQHGALMSRKSKARATILSCVDILQEKWSQRTFIAPPNKIKLNNKATHVIYYNVCLLHKQQCLLPGSLLPAEVFSLRLAVSQRGGSGKPWISVWERIRCCGMVFLHGLHWAQAYPTWTDTLNKPWSIVLLLPLAHSSCTTLIPCETQVYNWHKEFIPKSVSNWSDHLVCSLAVPKGLMSTGPSA